jgi:hypothetical protein
MIAYLGQQRANIDENITPTHGRVLKLIRKAEDVGHKLFKDNYFSSPQLLSHVYSRTIHSCCTVRHKRNGIRENSGPKMLTLKKGDLLKVRRCTGAVCWKELRGLSPQTNYTDRATAAVGEVVPTFADRGVLRGQRNGFPRPLISVF